MLTDSPFGPNFVKAGLINAIKYYEEFILLTALWFCSNLD